MQNDFERAYKNLNKAQKQAVDEFDGPMLVLAGPGTGKTQLLSARVANILTKTDTPARNILCLTFTENGARNMRERLSRFIGQAAYEVVISTYHAYGANLIKSFPEYFAETRLENPADELTQHEIVNKIQEKLDYSNPLKFLQNNIKDVLGTISEVKRALLTPEDLIVIAAENEQFIRSVNVEIAKITADLKSFPGSYEKALPLYETIMDAIKTHAPKNPASGQFGSLAGAALTELEFAFEKAAEVNKSTPLTNWKNVWLEKDRSNNFRLKGSRACRNLAALAEIIKKYQAELTIRGLYDYDDMILRAINALAANEELRFSLQEQHLYILLDEFQDTNAAQLKLVELLTNNPLSEGRPNVMAVGDDDQAIFAFQGAQYSNMIDFYNLYKDTKLVNLEQNYRSAADLLTFASNISGQISERLADNFQGLSKKLTAAINVKQPIIKRVELTTEADEFGYVAKSIKKLVNDGVSPSQIAVLSPKHKPLETLVPYLNEVNMPVAYEKRENILDAPQIKQIIAMSRLTLALGMDNSALADALWPEVLSYDFWAINTEIIWKLSWQISDEKLGKKNSSWAKKLLDASDNKLKNICLFFLRLAEFNQLETGEAILDYLTGSVPLKIKSGTELASPFRNFYLGEENLKGELSEFYEALTELTVLRQHLRDQQKVSGSALSLEDFVNLVDQYLAAGEPMLNTGPYHSSADAVQLMTVFKAKGLEFEHVFLVHCSDEMWGSAERSNNNSLSLPANLAPIRHAGASEDERLRLLYVALTRAKIGLFLTNYRQNYAGKLTTRLKYFDEREVSPGNFEALTLPEKFRRVNMSTETKPPLTLLELNWRSRHLAAVNQPKLNDLLAERLDNYKLSPTHLNSFIDLEYSGPQSFLFKTLLRFPEAPTVSGQFGNAVHDTLEWLQIEINKSGRPPTSSDVLKFFELFLKSKKLTTEQYLLELARGKAALTTYLEQRKASFRVGDRSEMNFKNEGVFVDQVHLGGKIDKMEIDEKTKTITVVDYKTGKGYGRWAANSKLHKYEQQLYCYKLLVENSASFRGYKVNAARLEFVEPNDDGLIDFLELIFDEQKLSFIKELSAAVWRKVMASDFPDVSGYPASLAGMKQFENDLVNGEI